MFIDEIFINGEDPELIHKAVEELYKNEGHSFKIQDEVNGVYYDNLHYGKLLYDIENYKSFHKFVDINNVKKFLQEKYSEMSGVQTDDEKENEEMENKVEYENEEMENLGESEEMENLDLDLLIETVVAEARSLCDNFERCTEEDIEDFVDTIIVSVYDGSQESYDELMETAAQEIVDLYNFDF